MDTRAPSRAWFALTLLFLINTLNFFDRQVIGAVAEPIRKEWGLDDRSLGILGTVFTLLYAAVGLPLGALTDRISRRRLLGVGVFAWSLFTAASGLARSFGQLVLLRLGVGIGEATCAPAATSLIGDIFPPSSRGKALSVFMLGLPAGIALSYYVSGRVAQAYGWREAFFVAGAPGLVCAALTLLLREPARGAAETRSGNSPIPLANAPTARSSLRAVLSVPTLWWLILSGVFHNFNMYAIGTFLVPFTMRVHGVQVGEAGDIAMVVYGLSGLPGLLLGGVMADVAARRWSRGRLLLGCAATLASAPLAYLALHQQPGATLGFQLWMGGSCALMYVYYSAVYATVHDVVAPRLRGTGMAVYFFAMYVLGASLGPVLTGSLSDHFTQEAALAAGVNSFAAEALEPFRGQGLRAAMLVIPILGILVAVTLYAGSRTVKRDSARRAAEQWR